MVIICDYPLSKCTFGYFNLLDGATFGWIVLNSLATNGDFVARLLAFSEVVKSSCFFLQKREINVGKSTTTDHYCNVFFQGNWVSHLFKWANWFSQINHFFVWFSPNMFSPTATNPAQTAVLQGENHWIRSSRTNCEFVYRPMGNDPSPRENITEGIHNSQD